MQIKPQYNDLTPYLAASDIIDLTCEIKDLAYDINIRSENITDFIQNAYEYVRDKISHSADINGKVITCRASDVLKAREGICYAKSHLLAAVLRCNHIPAGFCYQRLILNDESAPYLILHGLNAVYIEEYDKWIRLDARGNKPGVNVQFSLDDEQLAFPVRVDKGEEDIPIIFAEPDKNIISVLTESKNFETLWANLPIELENKFT